MDVHGIFCGAEGRVRTHQQIPVSLRKFSIPIHHALKGHSLRPHRSPFSNPSSRLPQKRVVVNCNASSTNSSSDDSLDGWIPKEVEQVVEETVPALGGADLTPDALYRLLGCFAIFVIAYEFHPYLLRSIHTFWASTGTSAAADSRFFSFMSLTFSILLGGTFTFQYKRLSNIINKVYREVFLLELLWRNCKLVDGLDAVMVGPMKRYINLELYFTEDLGSPFEEGSPLCDMYSIMETRQGSEGIDAVMSNLQTLGEAQNLRIAANVNLLPYVHWGLLWLILYFFAFAYLIFEPFTALEDVVSPRSFVFAVLFGLGTALISAVQDLSRPIEGNYSLRKDLKKRLRHLKKELSSVQPAKSNDLASKQDGARHVV